MSENKNTTIAGEARAEQEGRKENSSVMMLFESGNHVDVNASFYNAPSDVVRPIDAYVVTECGGDCAQAARYAVEAVYSVYQQAYPRKIGARQVVAFDLGGRVVSPITGNSGGLAFAVSAAKHIFSYDPGPVAATGHVVSSHGGGPVGGVRGVEAKVRRAMRELPSGGVIIYPKENEKELSDDLRREVAGAGLQFYSVSSVQEMLAKVFAVKIDSGQRNVVKMSILWLLFGVLLVIGGAFFYVKWGAKQGTPVPPVVEAPGKPSDKKNNSNTNNSTAEAENTLPKTTENPPLGETENTQLAEEERLDSPERITAKDKEQPNPSEGVTTKEKEQPNPPERVTTKEKEQPNPSERVIAKEKEQMNPPERMPFERKEAEGQRQFLDQGFD